MNGTSTASFPGSFRLHTGLAVSDIEASTRFYSLLLGISPSKLRPGYAKFEPRDPSVNLSLTQVSEVLPRNSETHYGIEVKSPEQFDAAHARLRDAGFSLKIEENVACCYAAQDKIWVTDPDGNAWEVFRVLDSAADVLSTSEECCSSDGCTDAAVNVSSAV